MQPLNAAGDLHSTQTCCLSARQSGVAEQKLRVIHTCDPKGTATALWQTREGGPLLQRVVLQCQVTMIWQINHAQNAAQTLLLL